MKIKYRILNYFKNWDSNTWFFAYGFGIMVEKLLRSEFIQALFFIMIYSSLTYLFYLLLWKKKVKT